MGFWAGLGGVISKVVFWVQTAAKPVIATVKKVATWAKDVATVTEAYLEGKKILIDDETERKSNIAARKNEKRPDIFDAEERTQESGEILVKIEEQRKQLTELGSHNQYDHDRIKLQIAVMELIVASQTFPRFASNIQLHESNLRIHFQTIQNSAGMLDEINRQRVGIKATIKQLNQVIFALNKQGITNLELIKNVDLEAKPGAISIAKAYEAFVTTKDLLEQEIKDYHEEIDKQIMQALEVKKKAVKVPNKKNSVQDWVDRQIIPSLEKSKHSSNDLLLSLQAIPLIAPDAASTLHKIPQHEQKTSFEEFDAQEE